MEQNTKIVMLIDTLGYGGGAERQFAGLAVSLHQRGCNVKVIAYHDRDGHQKELREAGVGYTIIPECRGRLGKLKAVRKQLKIERPDIVISYKDGPNSIACMLKALGATWKLIVSDRNTLQRVSNPIRVQYKLLYRFADAIVPNSYAQKQFIVKHFPRLTDKIHVITNFTDTETFHPASECQQRARKIILVAARISRQKNVLKFIEAAATLSPKWKEKAVIHWYGRTNVGEEEYARQCDTLISDYNLSEFLEFHSPVRDIDRVYRSSDIFCLPSLWEGFPNVLCEAMASGLPVCASRICDNEMIVDNGVTGLLFNPEDAADIASKIDRLLSLDDKEKCAMGSRARRYTCDNLSRTAFTDKYLSLIEAFK